VPNYDANSTVLQEKLQPIISYSRGPVVIVNGGRSKLNESAVGGAMGTELIDGRSISAKDALVRCKVPLPYIVESIVQLYF
jgi:hypothetical protein